MMVLVLLVGLVLMGIDPVVVLALFVTGFVVWLSLAWWGQRPV